MRRGNDGTDSHREPGGAHRLNGPDGDPRRLLLRPDVFVDLLVRHGDLEPFSQQFDVDGPALNSMIFVNPRALEEAEALDRERQTKGTRGPLHGIPIVLKDNYDTRDMPTTAGSLALAGSIPPDDAYQVRKLREAGAVFVGKTNMHELARGITTISSLSGQTRNPYDPERNPGGSSGGRRSARGNFPSCSNSSMLHSTADMTLTSSCRGRRQAVPRARSPPRPAAPVCAAGSGGLSSSADPPTV